MTAPNIQNNLPNAGKQIRLGRLINPANGRAALVAFDHGLHIGTIPGVENPGTMLETLADAGADGFLVAPGIARTYASIFTGRGAPGLIMRLDWTNRWRGKEALGHDEGRGRLIASVEDAARLGADAVLVYMFVGYADPDAEAHHIEWVARVVRDCETLGIGCIIEPMPRGGLVGDNPYDADFVALGARIACEIGADVLKTDWTGDAESFQKVTAAAFRPIFLAGGPKTDTDRDTLAMIRGALDAGAMGMFVGRNVFQAPDPGRVMRVLRSMIHHDLDVERALELLDS